MKKLGINYRIPTVTLIAKTGIGQSEIAARTCYDSFGLSEDKTISEFEPEDIQCSIGDIEDVTDSSFLEKLVHSVHHESIIEHTNLTFHISGVSRGVLQEHARHRLQGLSVESSRYTMSPILFAFIIGYYSTRGTSAIMQKLLKGRDIFVTTDEDYNSVQFQDIVNKLSYQLNLVGKDEFNSSILGKTNLEYFNRSSDDFETMFNTLMSNPKKRNVGDKFKHIVNDNWCTKMVFTMNLRSIKNYIKLRKSGAAFFQIQLLAEQIWEVIPEEMKPIISKSYNNKGH